MEKGKAPDGSFLARGPTSKDSSTPSRSSSEASAPKPVIGKFSFGSKASNDSRKPNHPVSSSGKLAFSLKQKSKIVTPIKLSEDDEDEEDEDVVKRQRLGVPDASERRVRGVDVAPPPPSDSFVREVADRLATFVAKDENIEHMTRQKNPGDTPFKFLFDESCAEYKYYQYRVSEERKALHAKDSQASKSGGKRILDSGPTSGSQRSYQPRVNYQTPASALYESAEDTPAAVETTAPPGSDPIAVMEFYMKKAAQEERRRQPRYSKDEMPPPPSLQVGGSKKGHHMGDFIPQEELEKFMATCNDAASMKAAQEAAQRAKIQADNVGHKLLSKMGWKEGEGLGSSKSGIADPIAAGGIKKDNLGVGASKPGEVNPEDDIYEQYKKRMMLGYKHRPNPLGNPRKAYY